jgi:sulfite exporter TauE/SafE
MIGSFRHDCFACPVLKYKVPLPTSAQSLFTLPKMIRRYIAAIIGVVFVAYALYLIATNGGQTKIVTMSDLSSNFSQKMMMLRGRTDLSKRHSTDDHDKRG